MKDLPHPERERDDVDHLIDALVADPGSAEDVKTLLRHKMAAPGVVAVAPSTLKKPCEATAAEADEDVDELWDNVPI